MNLKLRITRQAIEDINANKVWWEQNRSVKQANDWEDIVFEQIVTLVETASACPPSQENGRKGIAFPLQDKRLGLKKTYTHRAVFTIENGTIYVLAVRSTRQRDLEPDDLPGNLESGAE